MKKNISLLLVFTLVLSLLLSGCGQTSVNVPPAEDDTQAVSEFAAGTEEPTEEEEASDELEVPSDEDAAAEEAAAEEEAESADTESAPKSSEADSPAPEAAEPKSPEAAPQTPAPAPAPEPQPAPEPAPEPEPKPAPVPEPAPEETPASNTTLSGTNLTLRFGGGEEFTIHMYDNDTANKIAEYVGTPTGGSPFITTMTTRAGKPSSITMSPAGTKFQPTQ